MYRFAPQAGHVSLTTIAPGDLPSTDSDQQHYLCSTTQMAATNHGDGRRDHRPYLGSRRTPFVSRPSSQGLKPVSRLRGTAPCSPHRLKRPPLTRRLIAMPHPSHATAPASHATSLPVAREPLRTVHSHDACLTRSTSIPCKFWHAPCSLFRASARKMRTPMRFT